MYLVSGRCSYFGKTLKYIYNFVIKIIKSFNKKFQFLLALQYKLIQKKVKNAVSSLETEIKVLDYLEQGADPTNVEKRLGLSESTVRTIEKKMKMQLENL